MPAGGREALRLRFRQLLIDEVQSRRDETSERKVPEQFFRYQPASAEQIFMSTKMQRIAIVTGGGSGMGAAVAHALAGDGLDGRSRWTTQRGTGGGRDRRFQG